MSRIGDLLTGHIAALATGVASEAFNALFMVGRSIGGIIPNVTIEERAVDRVVATRHPIEQGAAITDHAYKDPSEVTMHVAWSNASLALRSFTSGSIFAGQISDTNDIYNQLLELQASRQLFDLVTGKRTYSNMLILEIANHTDASTENTLDLTIRMQQQIIVSTSSADLLQTNVQADPARTGPTQNAGTKQPIRSPLQSALSTLFGG